MSKYNGKNAEALASMYDDPGLVEMLESGDWTDSHGGYVHRHGAEVQITGAHGRWVPVTPRGGRLGRGYFKRPSAAAKRLADNGYLKPTCEFCRRLLDGPTCRRCEHCRTSAKR